MAGILPWGVHEDSPDTTEKPKISGGGGLATMETVRGPMLYAAKGEMVTCEQGHVICEVARNIWFGQPYAGAHFIRWRQPEPLLGTQPENIKCKECGSRWFLKGQVFHFKDGGWRYNNAEGLLRGEWPNRPVTAPGKIITP